MQFSLTSTVTPPDVHLSVDGELDIFTARQVSRAISQALWTGCRRVRLDASGVRSWTPPRWACWCAPAS